MRHVSAQVLLCLAFSSPILAGPDIILPSGLTLSPNQQTTFSIMLAQPAPYGGVFISVSVSDSAKLAISAPAVLINQGSTASQPIRLDAKAVGTASISATAIGMTGDTQVVTVLDPNASPHVITLPPPVTLAANQSVAFSVAVSPAAPAGGLSIVLTNSDPGNVALSSTNVFIAAGASTPAVQPQLTGLAVGSATLTASGAGYIPASQTVGVVSASSSSALSFNPGTLTIGPGQTGSLQLNLSRPASPGGVTVSLVSSNPEVITVSPAVTIPANAVSASVAITAGTAGSATITASANTPNITGTSAAITTSSGRDLILPSGITVGPGQQMSFPVTIPQPAPPGGVFISLTSSDTSKLTVSPTTVLILTGETALSRLPYITGISAGSATLTAAAYGLTGDSQLVMVGTGQQLLPGTLSLKSIGSAQSLSLMLSSAAPAGGVTFSLSSSNPGVATVPSSVTVAAGTQAVQVPVTGVASGTTTITSRSLPAYGDATASVTVSLPSTATISLPASLSLPAGGSASFPVTLATPAPAGGVVVSLTNSDSSKLSLSTASVFIPAGSASPPTQPQISGIAAGTSVIGASAPGYSSTTQTVQVYAPQPGGTNTLSFSPATLTLPGVVTGNIQLTLSAAAPTGGLVVNLASSNTAAVTVPATVTVSANSTVVSVPVTAVSTGSATITASSAASVMGASATVIVSSAQSIVLPEGLSMVKGTQASFPVTLVQPAPAGGLFVSLSSSDPSRLTISPPAVFINAGETSTVRIPQLTALAEGSIAISASAYGYSTGSAVVRVGGLPGFLPTSLNITGVGGTQTLTLTIPILAPAGGLTVKLSSDNPGVATVPATVVFPAGASTLEVPITSTGEGGTTIHANSPPILNDSMGYVTVTSGDVSVSWHGACWFNGTINGQKGLFHGMDLLITTSAPVTLQGSLFFTDHCDLTQGYDNMNDYNSKIGSGHSIQGFANNPDVIPSSALFWVGPRTVDGSCPKGVPCSGCVVYTKSTPDCSTLP